MKKNEKVEKLKSLGVYEKWNENVVNLRLKNDDKRLLNDESHIDWEDFILSSFIWSDSNEGFVFWNEISML